MFHCGWRFVRTFPCWLVPWLLLPGAAAGQTVVVRWCCMPERSPVTTMFTCKVQRFSFSLLRRGGLKKPLWGCRSPSRCCRFFSPRRLRSQWCHCKRPKPSQPKTELCTKLGFYCCLFRQLPFLRALSIFSYNLSHILHHKIILYQAFRV